MPGEDSKKFVTKKHLARLEREQIQRRYLITGITAVLILVIGVISYGLLDLYVLKDQKAVAMVGNEKITTGEFQSRVKYARWQLVERYNRTLDLANMFGGLSGGNGSYFTSTLQQIQTQLDDVQGLGKSVLDSLVDEKVIEQEAASQGITVDESEIDKAIQEAFGFFANGTPTVAPTTEMAPTSTLSPKQFSLVTLTPIPTLAPTATEMPTATPPAVDPTPTQETTPLPTPTAFTVEGFQKQYQDYIDSMKTVNFTEPEFRQAFRVSILREKLLKKITADTPAKEDQVWARHILVSDEQVAKDILSRLNKGESWDALASELSLDTSNKDSGGNLGWFNKSRMVAEFADAAFALQVGEISQPVKTSFGYHIIQVLGHEERPLDQTELAQKQQTEFNDWLTKVKTEKNVQTFDIANITPGEPALTPVAQ